MNLGKKTNRDAMLEVILQLMYPQTPSWFGKQMLLHETNVQFCNRTQETLISFSIISKL